MPLEHHPARSESTAATGMDGSPHGPPDASDYWHALINEKAAADFLGLNNRTLQGFRYRGGGPRYVRISSRCLRYRRVDLHDWAETQIRTSTSDPGAGAA